jgi:hypothetical protein
LAGNFVRVLDSAVIVGLFWTIIQRALGQIPLKNQWPGVFPPEIGENATATIG